MKSGIVKKKTTGIILLFSVILVMLAGCGSSADQPIEGGAPLLTIVAGKSEVQAMRTTFSWQDGNTGIEADGLHPLDMADDLPVLKVPSDGNTKLSFETEPDQITVLVWRWKAAGTEAYSDPDFRLPVTEEHTVMLPSNDRYLYQVHATWKVQDGVGGDAYYGFASAPGK